MDEDSKAEIAQSFALAMRIGAALDGASYPTGVFALVIVANALLSKAEGSFEEAVEGAFVKPLNMLHDMEAKARGLGATVH